MSTTEQAAKVSVNDLKADYLPVFNRTLSSILSTKLAEGIFAQIIDGHTHARRCGILSNI